MSALVIEPFADVAAWTARRPDGSPSTALTIVAGGPPRAPGLSGPSARLHADGTAGGHFAERSGAAADLTGFADLLLWVRSDRVADGTPDRPLFCEVRLGSAALAIGAAGNDWRRLVPIASPGRWQPVPLALADLPVAVRAALTTVRLTCVDAGTGWTLELDAVLAVRPQLPGDADAALLARLDRRLALSGAPVPAVLVPATAVTPPPVFRISNYDVRPDRAVSPVEGPRTDYDGTGFSIRPPATVYRLDYAIEALAADRGQAAAMLDFALTELVPTSVLLGAGRLMTAEWVDAPSTAAPPVIAPPADHPVVHLRVTYAQPGSAAARPAVPPFHETRIEVDAGV